MTEWKPIETAPLDSWIFARTGPDSPPIAVIFEGEDGCWEDETGDCYFEYRVLRSEGGLREWATPPEGWEPMWLGTLRDKEPIFRGDGFFDDGFTNIRNAERPILWGKTPS